MSIQISSRVKAYCDGGFHFPLDLSIPNSTKAAAEAAIRAQGWRIVKGKVFCPEHKP